ILSTKTITTLAEAGKNRTALKLQYATRTEAWQRTHLKVTLQAEFTKAIEKTTNIPKDAAIAVLSIGEKEHPSTSDSKSHFTTAFQKSNGEHITVLQRGENGKPQLGETCSLRQTDGGMRGLLLGQSYTRWTSAFESDVPT
ncbi:hypothetical protein CC86DRAFT_429066, partial [Ophiobolus disseminans]